jgi:hypothetical protein
MFSFTFRSRFLQRETKPPVPIGRKAGEIPEPVWALERREISLSSAGNRTPALCPVARRCTS